MFAKLFVKAPKSEFIVTSPKQSPDSKTIPEQKTDDLEELYLDKLC